jgi:hypothetical protein
MHGGSWRVDRGNLGCRESHPFINCAQVTPGSRAAMRVHYYRRQCCKMNLRFRTKEQYLWYFVQSRHKHQPDDNRNDGDTEGCEHSGVNRELQTTK